MNPDERNYENMNLPIIFQSQNNINNLMPLQEMRSDNLNNAKGKKINYFNKTTGTFLNINKKSYSTSENKETGKVKKIKISDLNKLKAISSQGEEEESNKEKEGRGDAKEIESSVDESQNILKHVDKENEDEDAKSADDEQPDPRINFEHINELNKARPQTSYGGLIQRKKKLQIALKSSKYRENNNNQMNNGYHTCYKEDNNI